MTRTEFIAARERLGLTPDELAAELDLPPTITAAWEHGSVAVPRRYAEELQWRVAATERAEALEASGLPECDWSADWDAKPLPDGLSAQGAHFEAFNRHAASCATCLAREQYIAERFPAMPRRPFPGAMGLLAAVTERVDRLPAWARPAAYGALAFLALTALRVLSAYPRWSAQPGGWLMVFGALAAGAGIGAVIGLVYSGYQAVRRRPPAVQA